MRIVTQRLHPAAYLKTKYQSQTTGGTQTAIYGDQSYWEQYQPNRPKRQRRHCHTGRRRKSGFLLAKVYEKLNEVVKR